MTALFTIGVLLLVLSFAASMGAALLRPNEKERIHAGISSFSTYLRSRDARIVTQVPLRFTMRLFDRLFGSRFFSLSRLFRSALFGGCMFLFSVGLSSLQSGNLPFPLEDSPWRAFDRSFEVISTSAKRLIQDTKQPPKTREDLAKMLHETEKLQSPENRWIYSLLFLPLLTLSATVFMSLSISFARRVLVEMTKATSLFSLLALGALCLILLPCLYMVAFAALYSIVSPIIWLSFVEFEKFGHGFPIGMASIMMLIMLVIGLLSASAWFKVLVITVILPVTATIFVWACALPLFFVRKPLHWLLAQFFERALSSRLGFLAICASVFGGLGILVVSIARMLGGNAPW